MGHRRLLNDLAEAELQLNSQGLPAPTVVVVQVGVGALVAAAVRYARRYSPMSVITVEPVTAACVLASIQAGKLVSVPGSHDSIMAGLNCATPSRVAWRDIATGVRFAISVDDAHARATMCALADTGITSGESGAAGVAGLLALAEREFDKTRQQAQRTLREAVVLAISTEGATDPAAYASIVGQDETQQ